MREPQTIRDHAQLQGWMEKQSFSKIFILVDSHTHQYCLAPLQTQVTALREAEVLEVDPGEGSKDIEIVAQLWQAMIELGADRKSLLINLGGGMITDLGGFVASTLKRGIPFIHIPTTVLAMVDAAIGGKTGINVAHLKNQVGSFSAPLAIVRIPSILDTLPEREYFSGAAEMIKHFLIAEKGSLDSYLEDIVARKSLDDMIETSAQIKEAIVAKDPFETSLRKTLNFGHTLGHAIESELLESSNPLLHGEAIAYGLIFALLISEERFALETGLRNALTAFVLEYYPPLPALAEQRIWKHMEHDKKNESGEVRMVLLKEQGHAVSDQVLTKEQFSEAFASFVRSVS